MPENGYAGADCSVIDDILNIAMDIENSQNAISEHNSITIEKIKKVCEKEIDEVEGKNLNSMNIPRDVELKICIKEKTTVINIINKREKISIEEKTIELISYLKENRVMLQNIVDGKTCK